MRKRIMEALPVFGAIAAFFVILVAFLFSKTKEHREVVIAFLSPTILGVAACLIIVVITFFENDKQV